MILREEKPTTRLGIQTQVYNNKWFSPETKSRKASESARQSNQQQRIFVFRTASLLNCGLDSARLADDMNS
jgi:hypothetical protein